MADGKRTPHVVRKERPARPTTPISAPALAELVEDLRTPDPSAAATLELPEAIDGDVDLIEMTVDDDVPPEPKQRLAHVVRRPKQP